MIENGMKSEHINSIRVSRKEFVKAFTSNEEWVTVIFGEIGFKSLLKMIKNLCGIIGDTVT